jgi:hypothetical protein
MRVANRFTSNLDASAAGLRCARASTPGVYDEIPAWRTLRLAGEVRSPRGPMAGKTLFVTAFDASDLDPRSGTVAPGRSPVAELRLETQGRPSVPFQFEVPPGRDLVIMAVLDAGLAGGPPGTLGRAQTLVEATRADTNLMLVLEDASAPGPVPKPPHGL